MGSKCNNNDPDTLPKENEMAAGGSLWPLVIAVLFINLAPFTTGLCLGFSAVTLPMIRSEIPNITDNGESWLASAAPMGMPFGALLSFLVVDCCGRKGLMLFGSLPFCISWIMLAMLDGLHHLCLARGIGGLGIGIVSGVAQIYITEISSTHERHVFSATPVISVNFGVFTVYLLGTFLPWRTVSWACSGIAFAWAFGMILAPESPVWLVTKGKFDAAESSLRRLRGRTVDVKDELASLIAVNYEYTKRNSESTLKDRFQNFSQPTVLKPLLLLCLLFVVQQCSGSAPAIFYSVDLFQSISSGAVNEYVATLSVGGIRVVLTIFTTSLINVIGCKPLLLASGVGMTFSMGVLSVASFFSDLSPWTRGISALSLFLFMVFYTIGFAVVPWVLIGELFPSDVRGQMGCAVSVWGTLLMFVAVRFYSVTIQSFGHVATFSLFTSIVGVGTALMYALLPETKGKELHEIQKFFAKEIPSANITSVETSSVENGEIKPNGFTEKC